MQVVSKKPPVPFAYITVTFTHEEFALLAEVLGLSSHQRREDMNAGWGELGTSVYGKMSDLLEGKDT